MYHPDIDIDIRESASQFAVAEKKPLAAPAVKAAPKDYVRKKLGKADDAPIYRLKKVVEDDVIVRFDIYEDVDGGKLVGTAGVKNDAPAPPIKINKLV